jgi:hypothetical protein
VCASLPYSVAYALSLHPHPLQRGANKQRGTTATASSSSSNNLHVGGNGGARGDDDAAGGGAASLSLRASVALAEATGAGAVVPEWERDAYLDALGGSQTESSADWDMRLDRGGAGTRQLQQQQSDMYGSISGHLTGGDDDDAATVSAAGELDAAGADNPLGQYAK